MANWLIAALFLSQAPGGTPPANLDGNGATLTAPVYHLSWDGHSSVLNVTLAYKVKRGTEATLTFGQPEMGGQTGIFSVVTNVTCDAADRVQLVPEKRQIALTYAGIGVKTLRYQIQGGKPASQTSILTELFRPVISDGSLFLPEFCLAMKGPWDKAQPRLVWDDFPAEATYLNTAAPNSGPNSMQPLLGEQTVLVMSRRVQKAVAWAGGTPHTFVFPRTGLTKGDGEDETGMAALTGLGEAVQLFARSYFPLIRRYWREAPERGYSLALLPSEFAEFRGRNSSGGFAVGDGFVQKFVGDFDLNAKYVLAHETSHHWIGTRLSLGKDAFGQQWFGEGYNDYLCALMLLASGIYSPANFLSKLNEDMRLHYTSKVREATGAEIKENFWKDRAYEKLPYRRGFIYAFQLDNRIRAVSKGKKSLRDLLLSLNAMVRRDPKRTLEVKDFVDAGRRLLPAFDLQADVDEHMVRGKVIEFKQEELVSAFHLYLEDGVPRFEAPDPNILKQFAGF